MTCYVISFVYLDDILIFSQNLEKHRKHIRKELQRLLKNHFFGKVEKCEFHSSSDSFLGYLEHGLMRMDPEQIRAVADWPTPTNVKRSLGFANFYHCLIQDFSQVTAPLTKLSWSPPPIAGSQSPMVPHSSGLSKILRLCSRSTLVSQDNFCCKSALY